MDSNTREEFEIRTKFGKHVSAAITSGIFVRGLAIVLVKILTMVLPKSDYGSYSLWLVLVIFTSMISTSPFSTSLWRFMQKRASENRNRASKLLTTCLLGSFTILSCFIIGVFMLDMSTGIFSNANSSFSMMFGIIAVLTIFHILREIILVLSQTEQNAREILVFTMAYSMSSTMVAGLIALITHDYRLVLVGLTVGNSVPILISFVIKVKQYKLSMPSYSDFTEVMKYGGPYMIFSSAVSSVSFITSFFAALLLGLSAVGSLSVTLVLTGIFALMVDPAMLAYRAYITNVYETGNIGKGNMATTRIMEIFILLAAFIFWIMIRSSSFLIELFSSTSYLDAGMILPFAVISTILLSFSDFWRFRLDLIKKTQVIAVIYFTGIVTLVASCAILLPNFGLVGLGFALVFYALVIVIPTVLTGNHYLPLPLRSRFGVLWALSFSMMVISDRLLQLLNVPSVVGLIISCIVYSIAVFSFGILRIDDVRRIFRMFIG